MPPAIIQWNEPQVHDDGQDTIGEMATTTRIGGGRTMTSTSRHKNNTSAGTSRSRYNFNDVVRRSVSKSKLDTPPSSMVPQFEMALCSGSEDASPSPTRSGRWQTTTTHPRQRKGRRKNYSLGGSAIVSFRAINAAFWVLVLLAILYCETNNGSHLPAEQGPRVPDDLEQNRPLALFPANMTTASYLDYQSSRRLRAEQVDVEKANGEILHVVHTRFMQNQPNLVNLGLARLQLFKEFTLRSMELQTSRNFLWVIRTDPALNASLRDPLVEALSGVDNHLLIASNENPNVQIHDIITVEPERVWSGDLDRVKTYLQSQSTPRKILESRLDADDGLHVQFVEHLQAHALEDLPDEMAQWKIWCASRHIEWQYHSVTHDFNTTSGILLSLKDSTCVSAGLTIGYTEGLHVHDLPPIKHEKLAHVLPSCDEQDLSCIDFINLFPTALRARTPTSAGMLNVLLGQKEMVAGRYVKGAKKQESVQNQLWAVTTPRFGFTTEDASRLRVYVKEHLRSIAEDNLRGQCSDGHSCKESSKLVLQAIIDDPAAFS